MFFFNRHFLADLASLGSKLMKKKKKAKSLCKVVPQGPIQGGVGEGQISFYFFGQVNILGFRIFFGE